MKYYFLTFIFTVICTVFIYGQDNRLIYSKPVSNKAEKSNELLRRKETYSSVDFVEINPEKILEYKQFTLQFADKNISVNKDRIDVRGINSYVFAGSNSEGSNVLLSVLGDDIQGVIETPDGVFDIATIGKKEYAVLKLDYSNLMEDCTNLLEEKNRVDPVDDANHNHTAEIENGNTTVSPILKAAAVYGCKIRALVLYTPTARDSASDIKNTVLTAVALTNESFVNSGINYQIELVYAGETGYTESGSYGTDLSRFTNAGDGYMDEVHTLRNKYSADICVLLAFFRGACGVATGIGVSVNNAFCLVSTRGSCAIGNYSFGHEIGHLLGCRHDMSFDSSTYPYAYAHGYVYKASTLQKSWRTIMAYPQDCQFGTDAFGNAIYCIRMRYWSNPSVFYDGIPMGSTTLHNNARIWNEQSDRVMTFRQPDNSITVTGSDIPNTRYADFIAKQDITTSGTVNGGSGNELYMRAGNSITLQSGFSVGLGSKFSAAIEDIYDCGSSSSSAPVIDIQDISEDNGDITNTPDFTYTVYPNPTDEFINITYSLDKITSLSIELLNLFGQKIRTVLPKQNRQAGSYLLQIPVSDFPVGTYFLTLSSETISKQDKIIINK